MKNLIFKSFFLALLISSKLFACDCKQSKNLQEIQNLEFKRSEYIFIGEVLEIDTKKHTFKVKVVENFKGSNSSKIYNGIYNESCGPKIDKTGKWIIYAKHNSGNFIKINSCGITRSLKNPENNGFATSVPEPPSSKETKSQTDKKITEWYIRAKSDLKNEIIELRKKTKTIH